MQVRYQAALRPDELQIISDPLATLGRKIALLEQEFSLLRDIKERTYRDLALGN